MIISKSQTGAKKTQSGAGIPVKTGVKAGTWKCRDCTGQAMGSQLFKPTCDYCMWQ